jgi:transposase
MLLDQIDGLTAQIERITIRVQELIAAITPAQAPASPAADGTTGGPDHTPGGCSRPLPAVARLDEIPGISPFGAQIIIAEVGLDMTRFPTAGHLVSWAKLCPRTIQSGPKSKTGKTGKTGKGNRYLKGVLSEIATAAAKTDTFLGERYRRIVKRRGKLRAMVAVARSILVIIWHLLADPTARYHDLGPDYHDQRVNTNRKVNSLVRQLEALGHTVTLQPTA